jgi:hypothetical protein
MLGPFSVLTLTVILGCGAAWLLRMKLVRHEATFWIVVPMAVFLAFIASMVQTAFLARHLVAIQSLLEDFRVKQRPRHLTELQVASLKTRLAPAAGHNITVWCYMGDAEAWSYAQDLLEAFHDAKWQTDSLPAPSTLRMQGTSLLVNDQAHLSPTAALVESALRKSKVPIGTIQFKTTLDDTIVLFVGRKETD